MRRRSLRRERYVGHEKNRISRRYRAKECQGINRCPFFFFFFFLCPACFFFHALLFFLPQSESDERSAPSSYAFVLFSFDSFFHPLSVDFVFSLATVMAV